MPAIAPTAALRMSDGPMFDGQMHRPAEGPADRSPVLKPVIPGAANQVGRDEALTLEVEQMGGPGDDHPLEGSAGPMPGAKWQPGPPAHRPSRLAPAALTATGSGGSNSR